ncbi:DUF5655 domain-containing protein [Portibacter marinus]|uniref:DUF5655 domain-containing protein n=1 Tax=Portibacter marinus TaxID=2898660 RepID=UPI001F3D6666|nr:DUF5655 domain-containing protein [Portibacter marinus]
MWICPKCSRRFANDNQSHYCTDITVDDLLEGKPENGILAFDQVLLSVYEFGDVDVGASVNTAIFTNKKAFLIVRPMSKILDLKFYYDEPLKSGKLHKVGKMGKKFYHHIRISNEEEVDDEVVQLLKKGYDQGMKS